MAAGLAQRETLTERVQRLVEERRRRQERQEAELRRVAEIEAAEREQRSRAQQIVLAQLQGDGRSAAEIAEARERAAVAAAVELARRGGDTRPLEELEAEGRHVVLRGRLTLLARALAVEPLRAAVQSLLVGDARDPDQLVQAGAFARVLLERRGLDVRGVAVQARWHAGLGHLELLAVEEHTPADEDALVAGARAAAFGPRFAGLPTGLSVWRIDAAGNVIPVCGRARRMVARLAALRDNRLTDDPADDLD